LPGPVVGISNAIDVEVSITHTCALLTGGRVRCWGRNHYGQVGDGTHVSALVPAAVIGF